MEYIIAHCDNCYPQTSEQYFPTTYKQPNAVNWTNVLERINLNYKTYIATNTNCEYCSNYFHEYIEGLSTHPMYICFSYGKRILYCTIRNKKYLEDYGAYIIDHVYSNMAVHS